MNYEKPVLVDLSSRSEKGFGEGCLDGSGESDYCDNGPTAGDSCSTGPIAE